MISYNSKDWQAVLFKLNKADTLRKLLPFLLAIGIYSWGVAYVEVEVLNLADHPHLRSISLMHNLLGFAISMLLVFRKAIPLYAAMLRDHLRAETTRLALDEIDHPELVIDTSRHLPNQVAALIMSRTLELHRKNIISGEQLIFTYILTLPIGFIFNLGYFVIPVVVFVSYVLASLEVIAEEIEDPFGGDANDVPTEKITENIRTHITELLPIEHA
jgi:ion channel-forming bestrophin family protein